MKKLFILLVVICATAATRANAQIYRSQSRKIELIKTPKEKRTYDNDWGHDWFLKAGAGILMSGYINDVSVKYNFKAGYRKQIHGIGLYYGALIGLTNSFVDYRTYVTNYYGSHWKWNTKYRPALLLEPLFGIKYRLGTTNTSIDAHIACGYERVLATNTALNISNSGNLNKFSAEGGIGVWFNRFFVGAECQVAYSSYIFDSGVAANVGYRF